MNFLLYRRSCIRTIVGIRAFAWRKTTDRGKESVTEGVRTLDMLSANQKNVNRRLDKLTADVQLLIVEIRHEFNLNRERQPYQPFHWEETHANRPIPRRRAMVGRNEQHLQANLQEPSDSEDEPPPVQGYDPRESSEEEIANRYVADYPRNR
ncbi:uncharacterized protein LOC110106733 isoform X2 [Dendrobium catenatum]|uniref:uncharacterized protein LOC110106733 isoform X2 n=1 Tax=Dendrobium catenatum TaxID=906689 RepID=UPI0010A0B490|nr:uncharacterized protein LOC110106733 isoform X2 [Dendrobium catenatum]